MNLSHAQTELVRLLDAAIAATDVDFADKEKSPSRALRDFRGMSNSASVPLLFKNDVAKIQNNLRGLLRHGGLSQRTFGLLQDCVVFSDRIKSELPIDLGDQIKLSNANTSLVSPHSQRRLCLEGESIFECRLAEAETAETVKAVVKLLSNNGGLDDSQFTEVRRISLWENRDNLVWQNAYQDFLDRLPVDRSSMIVGWIDSDVVIAKWSQVLDNSHLLFNDNFILPIDVSWILLFFHEQSLQYGIR